MLTAYQDVGGVWSIGYGDTTNVTPDMKISEEEAKSRLFARIMEEFLPGVQSALSKKPTRCQLDAMVSLAYNIGVGAFKSSTLVKKFNLGSDAADEFLRWDKVNGKSVKGLRRRRTAERARFIGMSVEDAITMGDSTQ